MYSEEHQLKYRIQSRDLTQVERHRLEAIALHRSRRRKRWLTALKLAIAWLRSLF